jgi:cellulose synthase/poly-beta-1,6-N-acetylglucosamine synthase-like glycosyltransferase
LTSQIDSQDLATKVVVIFPAKNEEGTIANSIATAKQSHFKPDVILVDAYSTDRTSYLAEKAGAIVIQQPTRIFPAKGLAMRAGLSEAFKRSANIIVFLDADIRNLTPQWVDKLVQPLMDDNCDMSRGFYSRHARDAAVTKLIARPMLHTFFPELSHFEQPLSGEVCARRQVWENILKRAVDNPTPDGWGIDVWLLIEAAMSGYHIKEIFMGTKEHTSFEDYREDVSKLTKMAEQVEFTIIREAIKYNRLELQKVVNI